MKVSVLSNINSGQYVPGDVAEFPDEEAKLLIEAKAAEPYVDEKPAEQSADGFPQHEQQPVQQAPTPPAAPPQPAPAPQPQPAAPPAPTQPQGGQPTPEEVAAAAAMAE